MISSVSIRAVDYKEKTDAIITNLENKYQLKFTYDSIPEATWPKVGYCVVNESYYRILYWYVKLFAEEFNKYPVCMIEKINLKCIAFVIALNYDGQYRAALPDAFKEILFYDILRGRNDTIHHGLRNRDYLIHVIHHEMHHMLEEEINGSYYYQDSIWLSFNDTAFLYGAGGASYYPDMIKKYKKRIEIFRQRRLIINHNIRGIISKYSGSAIEEDKSEIFASLFINWEIRRVKKYCKHDEILRKKVEYMKASLFSLCEEFEEKFNCAAK